VTQMTELPAARRVGYRDRTVWLGPLIWLIILGARWLLVRDLTLTWPLVIWVVGIVVVEANGVLVGMRSMRGLTLAADGITWHKHELFLPWSNVADMRLDARNDLRLVVGVVEPDLVLEGVPRFGGFEVRSNLKRFGGPIALKADRLAAPSAQIMADAEQLRQQYAAAGGLASFADSAARPDRERAARSANVWGVLGRAGLILSLLGAFLAAPGKTHAHASGGLTFRFRSISGPGFMDQVVDIGNPGGTAVAPTLAFVPLDRDGREMRDITVRTAYGSDRGMVVVPPHFSAYDVLAFVGLRSRQVMQVRAIAGSKARAASPAMPATELHAQRVDSSGNPVQVLKPFTALHVANPNSTAVSVRLVCIIWEQPPPGSPQQMLAAIPIGGLNQISPRGETTIAVTGPARDHTQLCGSVKVYFSR
jgi:hypothetical protein